MMMMMMMMMRMMKMMKMMMMMMMMMMKMMMMAQVESSQSVSSSFCFISSSLVSPLSAEQIVHDTSFPPPFLLFTPPATSVPPPSLVFTPPDTSFPSSVSRLYSSSHLPSLLRLSPLPLLTPPPPSFPPASDTFWCLARCVCSLVLWGRQTLTF